jgi:hypothetical protein
MTIDWDLLATIYADWRIAGFWVSGTRDHQELVLRLERQVDLPEAVHDVEALQFDADTEDWGGFDDALAAWRGCD